MVELVPNLFAAFVYAVLGVVMLLASFLILDWATPGSLWKEIIEEHNEALAIMVGAFFVGLSIVIAAAIF